MKHTQLNQEQENAITLDLQNLPEHELQFAIQYCGENEWSDELKEAAQTELNRREIGRINVKRLAKFKTA
jgi:hypothetical protein